MEIKSNHQTSNGSWKTYSRSISCIEQPSGKPRASLPPLQPLSVRRPSLDSWPKPATDDVGDWLNPSTPAPRENPLRDQLDLRREKLAFYDKECSKILDHVYLGGEAIAKNRDALRRHGITHVLNCAGSSCPEYFAAELAYKTLWLKDSPAEDITSVLYDYFEDVGERGGRVFVHCRKGISRSTSLVVAYLMWKEGKTFDAALRRVRAARGIANPNAGFAEQLLRVQAPPVKVYRMGPHSPCDPLHLVPKTVPDPNPGKLDSRGAFIVQFPSRLYVWVGRSCLAAMGDEAVSAASQVARYEKVVGPVVAVEEGEEGSEFWDAFSNYYSNDGDVRNLSGRRTVSDYDLDFEIFGGAISGEVAPRFSVGPAENCCLPMRESGWNRLRKKLAEGTTMKSSW